MKVKKQYIYVLKLREDLLDEDNWTEKENEIVENHYYRLKDMAEEGIVILAGRTLNNDASAMGIVIFEAINEEEAQKIMNDDPAVKNKIMTAKLFPYKVALMSNINN